MFASRLFCEGKTNRVTERELPVASATASRVEARPTTKAMIRVWAYKIGGWLCFQPAKLDDMRHMHYREDPVRCAGDV